MRTSLTFLNDHLLDASGSFKPMAMASFEDLLVITIATDKSGEVVERWQKAPGAFLRQYLGRVRQALAQVGVRRPNDWRREPPKQGLVVFRVSYVQ